MPLKIQILEDEALQVMKMKSFCESNGYQVVATADNVSEALRQVPVFKADIALVDINVKGDRSGIDFGMKVRESYDIKLIYITSLLDEKTIELASKVNPEAYLVKPADKQSLKVAIELAANQFIPEVNQAPLEVSVSKTKSDTLFIKVGHVFKRISLNDIYAISSGEKNHSDLLLENSRSYSVRKPLASLEELLPSSFWRIHRKHIVNSDKISGVDSAFESVQIEDVNIPISRSYQKFVANKFQYLS